MTKTVQVTGLVAAVQLCQCPEVSIDHALGRCQRRAQYSVERNGAQLLVCGDCTSREDRNSRRIDGQEDEA